MAAVSTTWQITFKQGISHFKNGRYDEAIQCFNEASLLSSRPPLTPDVQHIGRHHGCQFQRYEIGTFFVSALRLASLSLSEDRKHRCRFVGR